MELLYHYLWKNRLFGLKPQLDSGQRVEVINPGIPNPDAGPDFFNAKVRMDGMEWIGNVEIHVRASDWYRHKHHTDTAYDSVILHVVGSSDREIYRADGSLIPQMTIPLPKEFYMTYAELAADLKAIRCGARLKVLSRLTVRDWLESLGVERLQSKADRILRNLEENSGDWNSAAFVTLARGLGFGLNAEPFELLARSVPLKYLLRHSDNRFQLEAILLGQARLIPEDTADDPYAEKLRAEYLFLATKYGLTRVPSGIWRFARTRPQNFPYRRIAFLAAALSDAFPLPGILMDRDLSSDKIRKTFSSWKLKGYWADHYSFGNPSAEKMESLARRSVESLMINVASPFIYASACRSGNPESGETASDILNSIPAERNSIVSGWGSIGIKAENAFESQALIQLRREYCDRSECLRCRFGSALLKQKAKVAL